MGSKAAVWRQKNKLCKCGHRGLEHASKTKSCRHVELLEDKSYQACPCMTFTLDESEKEPKKPRQFAYFNANFRVS